MQALLLFLCLQLHHTLALSLGATWAAVVSGANAARTCGLAAAGGGNDLHCWGWNAHGQLGLGYTNGTGCTCVPSRPAFPVLKDVSTVALGTYHTCALFTNATVACWGLNTNGQLGGGRSFYVLEPEATCLLPLPNVVGIAAGEFHTCAVTAEGRLYCWGCIQRGLTGNGMPPAPSPSSSGMISHITVFPMDIYPVMVRGIRDITAVACGASHTCVLTSSGGVFCWGSNYVGQLGGGDTVPDTLYSPPASPVLTHVTAMTAGRFHTCALITAGGVHCWGLNIDGQLGVGYVNTSEGHSYLTTPPSYPVMTGVTQISAGASHTCALTTSGGVYCWGGNQYGQLGNGFANSGANVLSPPSSPALKEVAAITTGYWHTCALMKGGHIECWGGNGAGELGIGDTTVAQVNAPPSAATQTLSDTTFSPAVSRPLLAAVCICLGFLLVSKSKTCRRGTPL